jgi:hypothetical protein
MIGIERDHKYIVRDKVGRYWAFATAHEVAVFMLGKSNLTWSIWKRVDAKGLSPNVTIMERQIEAMEPGKGDKPCQSDT